MADSATEQPTAAREQQVSDESLLDAWSWVCRYAHGLTDKAVLGPLEMVIQGLAERARFDLPLIDPPTRSTIDLDGRPLVFAGPNNAYPFLLGCSTEQAMKRIEEAS